MNSHKQHGLANNLPAGLPAYGGQVGSGAWR